VNSDNSIEEETQYRITLGNKAYYANKFSLKLDWSPRNQNSNYGGVLTLRSLMSYIYMEHLFLMFLDHTQRRSTVGRTPLDE